MVTARPHLFSILGIALLVATAGLHLPAMTGGSLPQSVLGNQIPGCATTTCPKKVEVFGLLVSPPHLDPAGRAWLPSPPSLSSIWILSIPHVGRAPPTGRV